MSRASKELGRRIRILRLKRGLTQNGLGMLLCLNQSTISRYEKGSRIPDSIVLKQISIIFDCSVDILLGTLDNFL